MTHSQKSRINRRVSLTIVTAIALFGLSACGEKRSVQCQKIGDILNASSSQRLSASSTPQGFSKGAEISRQAATDLQALELGDKKLGNLRSHLVLSFQTMAESATAMDAIAGPDGAVTYDANSDANHEATFASFEASGKDFATKFNALQTYCNGGSVPDELLEAPVQ